MFLIAPSIDVKQVHFGPKLLGVLDIVWVKKPIRFLRIVFAHVRVFDEIAQANARLGTKIRVRTASQKRNKPFLIFGAYCIHRTRGISQKNAAAVDILTGGLPTDPYLAVLALAVRANNGFSRKLLEHFLWTSAPPQPLLPL
jgi:hypothetical protein